MRFNLIPPRHTVASAVRQLAEGLESGAIVLRPGTWGAEPVPEITPDLLAVAETYHCSDCGHYHADYVCPGCGRRNDDWGPEPGDNRQRCLGCGRWVVVYCDPAGMP